jgi:hypothetical protein
MMKLNQCAQVMNLEGFSIGDREWIQFFNGIMHSMSRNCRRCYKKYILIFPLPSLFVNHVIRPLSFKVYQIRAIYRCHCNCNKLTRIMKRTLRTSIKTGQNPPDSSQPPPKRRSKYNGAPLNEIRQQQVDLLQQYPPSHSSSHSPLSQSSPRRWSEEVNIGTPFNEMGQQVN